MWLLFMLVICLPLTLLRGWVFLMLWSWFVTPVFNLPALNLAVSVGLCTLIGFFTSALGVDVSRIKQSVLDMDQNKLYIESVISSILWSLIALGTGFIAHLFM